MRGGGCVRPRRSLRPLTDPLLAAGCGSPGAEVPRTHAGVRGLFARGARQARCGAGRAAERTRPPPCAEGGTDGARVASL